METRTLPVANLFCLYDAGEHVRSRRVERRVCVQDVSAGVPWGAFDHQDLQESGGGASVVGAAAGLHRRCAPLGLFEKITTTNFSLEADIVPNTKAVQRAAIRLQRLQ